MSILGGNISRSGTSIQLFECSTQLGLSTFECALVLVLIVYEPYFNTLVLKLLPNASIYLVFDVLDPLLKLEIPTLD
jgi:hypothetical protein